MRYLPVALLLVACAKIAPPPGKPELNPPSLKVVYDSVFTGFPIHLEISIKDESGVALLEVLSNDGKFKYFTSSPHTKDTTLQITLDTLVDYPPIDTVWRGSNLRVVAKDYYDNASAVRIFIRNPEYSPPVKDTTDKKQGK